MGLYIAAAAAARIVAAQAAVKRTAFLASAAKRCLSNRRKTKVFALKLHSRVGKRLGLLNLLALTTFAVLVSSKKLLKKLTAHICIAWNECK
jgi:hypothetical protein